MAKKKKQGKGKTPKGKPAKLPKDIAGVSISKELRNAVEPVLRFASHPLVSDTLAGALLAGADALTGKAKKKADDKAANQAAAATAGAKGRNSIGLLLAIAAGEIASHIVSAYRASPGEAGSPDNKRGPSGGRRAVGSDRRTKQGKGPGGKERRSGQDRRTGPPDRRK
jgi:hypothetical protein